jgi:predicted kinase
MMGGVLVVMSGLPGSGKSSIADRVGRELGAPILSVDPIEAAMWRAGIAPSFETGVAAYEVAAVLAEQHLALGLTVIVDSVSAVDAARARWRRAAASVRRELVVIEVTCSDEDLRRRRLADRRRPIPGFPEPTWADVQQRRVEWEPWVGDRLVIDTVGHLDANVGEVLAYLRR